jgi:hypothetical protein
MTSSNGAALPAYGLTANPFARRTLDPLRNSEDRRCVSMVDGWKDLSAAKDLIKRRVAADQAVFFVIAGQSSTGRSSVANYLVHLWAEARGIDDQMVVVHRRDPGSTGGVYTWQTQIMEWAQTLLLRVDARSLGLERETKDELRSLSDSSGPIQFGEALQHVDQDLRSPKGNDPVRHLAAIFERGKSSDLMRWVKECFQVTRALIIVTVDDQEDTKILLAHVKQFLSPDEGLKIDCGPILGLDVATLIRDRWDAACKGVESPFDLAAIAEVFDQPRNITRVMSLLERMLHMRQLLYSGQDSWPNAQGLDFSADQIRGLLAELDGRLPTGLEA